MGRAILVITALGCILVACQVKKPEPLTILDVSGGPIVRGASVALQVTVDRDGITGPIALQVEDATDALQSPPAEIPAGSDVGMLTLEARNWSPTGPHSVDVVARGGGRVGRFALAIEVRGKPGTTLREFGDEGTVLFGGTGTDKLQAMAVQSDGKIVVAGCRGLDFLVRDFVVARLMTDGYPDVAFGTVTIDFGGQGECAFALAISPDDSIVVAGESNADFALARLGADGALDTGFGVDGKTTVDLGGGERIRTVAVRPDGTILAAGRADAIPDGLPEFAIAGFLADGSLDTSFGGSGTGYARHGRGDSLNQTVEHAETLLIQPEEVVPGGRIVLAGPGGQPDEFVTVGLRMDGTLDTSYGMNGFTTLNFPAANVSVHDGALRPDGSFHVAGGAGATLGDEDFTVARYSAGGILDQDYGVDGLATHDAFFRTNIPVGVSVTTDGKAVVGGLHLNGQWYAFLLVRFDADGALDPTFGEEIDGRTITSFTDSGGASTSVEAAAMIVDRGRIIVGGTGQDGIVFAGYWQ